MREILFKAKRIDNGEWVEGGYAYVFDKDMFAHILGKITEKHCIVEESGNFVIVDKTTICQYTGLTDKNGKKIWENDVVFVTDDDGNSGQIDTGIGEIDFLEGLWYINGRVQNSLYDINKCFQIEVIGNVFDNPEWIERKE